MWVIIGIGSFNWFRTVVSSGTPAHWIAYPLITVLFLLCGAVFYKPRSFNLSTWLMAIIFASNFVGCYWGHLVASFLLLYWRK